MKHVAVFCFAVVLLLSACGDGDPSGVADNGSIRGTVTDESGATVANASVELTGNGQDARTTTSGSDGVYTFSDVPAGTYTLTITPPSGFTVGAVGSASIDVASDAQANASAFVLERVVVNGSISGRVYDRDANGGGVFNASIALTGNGQAARTTATSVDGLFTFTDVPPGTYQVALTPPPGFNPVSGTAASVTLANGASVNSSLFTLAHDSCGVARPDFGGQASEADLALFAYDASAPLNLQTAVVSTANGVEVSNITYASPAGGRVPGIMTVPIGRTGPLPAIVILHPGAMSAQGMVPYATVLSQQGAIVIAIDAPPLRRGGSTIPVYGNIDRVEQIQLIKDLQRAVDVLLARPDVDPARIGFEGYSYGGIFGAQFVGVEHRLKAAVLAAAHGGHVTGITTTAGLNFLATNLTCAGRNAWLRDMVPIEPIRYIPHATAFVLFQMGQFDTAVLFPDATALAQAAPEPKDVRVYPTGHGLNTQALAERRQWWHQQLGMDP